MSELPDPLRIFARQALRTALVADWFEALNLREGDSMVDLGCGAGYVSMRAAARVGSTGTVHAVDTNPEAIQFLRDLAALHGLHQIRCRVQDLIGLEPLPERPRGGVLSMVLHHVERPAEALRRIADAVHGAPILIAEFDADGPCRVGPPREMRMTRDRVEDVAREAGMQPRTFGQQTAEHWFLVVA